jgi:Trk K+ transport system NAD-binding subunit
VKEGTPLTGKTIGTLYERLARYDFEVIAVTRREHVLLPHPETLLEPNDRLVVITSPEAQKPLEEYIAPVPQPQAPQPPSPGERSD